MLLPESSPNSYSRYFPDLSVTVYVEQHSGRDVIINAPQPASVIAHVIHDAEAVKLFRIKVQDSYYCEAELVHAPEHETAIYRSVGKNDWCLQFVFMKYNENEVNLAVLITCLEYFSILEKIEGVYMNACQDEALDGLLEKAGFRYSPQTKEISNKQMLYYIRLNEQVK